MKQHHSLVSRHLPEAFRQEATRECAVGQQADTPCLTPAGQEQLRPPVYHAVRHLQAHDQQLGQSQQSFRSPRHTVEHTATELKTLSHCTIETTLYSTITNTLPPIGCTLCSSHMLTQLTVSIHVDHIHTPQLSQANRPSPTWLLTGLSPASCRASSMGTSKFDTPHCFISPTSCNSLSTLAAVT